MCVILWLQVAPIKYCGLLTTATGLLNVGMTLVSILLIERLGRRKLFLYSAMGTTGTMLICLISVATDAGVSVVVPVMIMLFIMSFAIGWGPCVWIYLSDIYPAEIKVYNLRPARFPQQMAITPYDNVLVQHLLARADPDGRVARLVAIEKLREPAPAMLFSTHCHDVDVEFFLRGL